MTNVKPLIAASLSGYGRISATHRAHKRCFIANGVSCPVEIEPRE
jgi:hypothetical protein